MPETTKQLYEHLRVIEQWERDQRDIWFFEKILRIPFVILDKLTPQFVQRKIAQALDELGSFVQSGGKYLTSPQATFRILNVTSFEQLQQLPLSIMIQAADYYRTKRKRLAMMQGATLGFGGVFTLLIDIPAVIGLSLKVIQETAVCYGYDPHVKNERIFAVKVLQFSASDLVGKQAILAELSSFEQETARKQTMSQLQGWREVIMTYRDNYGWKKMFKAIPIVSVLFGAWMNRSTIHDVAEAADMMYRKRRVLAKLERELQVKGV